MSLRDALRAAVEAEVARCASHSMQPATFCAEGATGRATITQQATACVCKSSLSAATADATVSQLGGCVDPSEVPAIGAPNATEVASVELLTWTDADIARFIARRDRLLRWGWSEPDAEATAERLARRDRFGDDRMSCTDCTHYRATANACRNHAAAGLGSPDVSRDLAGLLQRCPGHAAVTM